MQDQEKFSQFISEIVHNEMDETQQSIFELEGEELITKLFELEDTLDNTRSAESLNLDFGFGSDEISVIVKHAIEVAPILISSFTLYLTIRRDLNKEKEDRLKELKAQWKSRLILDENIDEKIAEAIVNKYSSKLLKIADA
jgi:hypothetical protein